MGQAPFVRPLLSSYCLVRLLIRVHVHLVASAFMNRPGPHRARMRSPRFRTKDVSACMGSTTAQGPPPASQLRGRQCCLLFYRTRSAPRNYNRFAAQYPACGLPCERFTAALADRTSCITRGRGGWLALPREGLAPPIFCQLVLAHPIMVNAGTVNAKVS